MNAIVLSVTLLAVYSVLGSIDALYLHLWRFRLFQHPASRGEHFVHTLRTVLFPAIVLLLYVRDSVGFWLWCGAVLAALDLGVAVVDMALELRSRAPLGGLQRGEYVLHGVLSVVHGASLALTLVARPGAAWFLDASGPALEPALAQVRPLATQLVPGSVIVALLHLALLHPRFVRASNAHLQLGRLQ